MYLLNSVSRVPNAPKTPRCSDSNDVNVLKIRPTSALLSKSAGNCAIGL